MKEGSLDIGALAERVRGSLTAIGKAVIRDVSSNPVKLAQRRYWEPYAAAGH